MKFLVDDQLLTGLVKLLQLAGVDTIHTKDLPGQNATADVKANVSMQQERIVRTKDSDFLDSFLINGQPYGRHGLFMGVTQYFSDKEFTRVGILGAGVQGRIDSNLSPAPLLPCCLNEEIS